MYMVLHFKMTDKGINTEDTSAILNRQLLEGRYSGGSDSVMIVPPWGKVVGKGNWVFIAKRCVSLISGSVLWSRSRG